MPAMVPSMASRTMSIIGRPSASAAGTPSSAISASATTSPLPERTSATMTMPAKASERRSRLVAGDDLAAEIDEPVLDRADGALVAGDGARGEDDEVALVQLHLGVLVIGDARHRRSGLPLAPGAQQQHLMGLQVREVLLV